MLELFALSPIDGRYSDKVNSIRNILSEYGLIYYRTLVEIQWLQHLADQDEIEEVPPLSNEASARLTEIIATFSTQDAAKIKEIEKVTNHDVKAVEYFIKQKLNENTELARIAEFTHFGCTSEDINNLAYAMMLKRARDEVLVPQIERIISSLRKFATSYADNPMIARTHGQPATPTTMGKEFANVIARMKRQLQHLRQVRIVGKLNGAVGNFNAHVVSYPAIDWPYLTQKFIVNKLGLKYQEYTTQIEPHDYIAEYFHSLMRLNTILMDFDRDLWNYIAINYFTQKSSKNETGSSTMPHKVNPIDFENSEGNLGVANALMTHLSEKLPISRWQRDLTDSTVLRNIGMGIAYSLIAYQASLKGLSKIELNTAQLEADLANNIEVLGEAIQTVMRRYGIANPYERLKSLTRGEPITEDKLKAFIDNLELPDKAKKQIKNLTPRNYTGLARYFAKKI